VIICEIDLPIKVAALGTDAPLLKNELFATLEKVIDKLCDTIVALSKETIKSITGRDWIVGMP